MTAHPLGLPFALDRLIAEARRRARQRRVLIVAAVVLVVGGGVGAAIIAASSSSELPSRAAFAPSVLSLPDEHTVGAGKPARFSIVVGLINGSREPVSLRRVRAVVTARSALRQIATRFALYTPKIFACPRPAGGLPGICVPPGPQLGFSIAPHGAPRPSPLRVAPGREALVQLTFQNRSCTIRAMKESFSMQTIAVVYGLSNGSRIYQHPRLPLSQPATTDHGKLALSAMPAIPGQPASRREHTVGWFTTNPCNR
jgi:hypothetical protein